MNPSITSHLTQILAQHTRQDEFSGAVLVRQGGADLFCQAYGFANRTWNVKNRPTTRFRIASVGKLFTALAILQLVDAGRVSLETCLSDFLDLSATKIPPGVTVFHLLTMTSGIADWSNEESETFEADWEQFCRDHPLYLFRSDADYLPVFSMLEPYGLMGEKFRYNGAGFILLGLLIEKISGQTYFDYVRQHIFKPSGMSSTDFLDLDDVVPNIAEGYIPVKNDDGHTPVWKKNYYATTAGPAADGGATSTLADLARFIDALRQGQLISTVLLKAMTSPQVVEDEDNDLGFKWRYGLGCYVLLDDSNQIVRWGHTGEEEGVSCRLWYYPRQDVTVVILGNQSSCAGQVSRAIQDLIFQL